MKKLLVIFVLLVIGFSNNSYAESYKCKTDSHGRFSSGSTWEDFGDQNFLITLNEDNVEVYDFKIEMSAEYTITLNNDYFLNAFFVKTLITYGDWIGLLKYNKSKNKIVMMTASEVGETIYSGFCK